MAAHTSLSRPCLPPPRLASLSPWKLLPQTGPCVLPPRSLPPLNLALVSRQPFPALPARIAPPAAPPSFTSTYSIHVSERRLSGGNGGNYNHHDGGGSGGALLKPTPPSLFSPEGAPASARRAPRAARQ